MKTTTMQQRFQSSSAGVQLRAETTEQIYLENALSNIRKSENVEHERRRLWASVYEQAQTLTNSSEKAKVSADSALGAFDLQFKFPSSIDPAKVLA